MTNDRLDLIDQLLREPGEYQKKYGRPLAHDYQEAVTPVLEAIRLLAQEIREIKQHLTLD